MADSVPDNETFSLQDIIDVVGGTSLQECFDNAVLAGFDGNYDDYVKGSGVRDSTYNFRNYQVPASTIETIVNAYYGPVSNPISCHTYYWTWGVDFPTVRNTPSGILSPVAKQYFDITAEIVGGALESTYINRAHVRFDFTHIPPGSTIVSAELEIVLYWNESFGVEYSYANNYGPITLHESNVWSSPSGAVYGSIKRNTLTGVYFAPLFNGSSRVKIGATQNSKYVLALPSDFTRLESFFGSYLYATFVTRQDRDLVAPGYGEKLGIHISAPTGDYNNPNRRLNSIRIHIEYTP